MISLNIDPVFLFIAIETDFRLILETLWDYWDLLKRSHIHSLWQNDFKNHILFTESTNFDLNNEINAFREIEIRGGPPFFTIGLTLNINPFFLILILIWDYWDLLKRSHIVFPFSGKITSIFNQLPLNLVSGLL